MVGPQGTRTYWDVIIMMSWLQANKIARKHKLAQRGIRYPKTTVREARKAGLPLSLACAFLMQESAGGQNVFGHDPVANPVKGGKVTKSRYLEYKTNRKRGLGMQGVGPMQLTWYAYQDAADAIGGCWKVSCNMRVGFRLVTDLIKQHGTRSGIRHYNGAGPAAERYASEVLHRKATFDMLFKRD